MQQISGQLIDIHCREIYPAIVSFQNGSITAIERVTESAIEPGFILPGFVDAHVHIESSMLPPSEFARLAVVHGTVATVSDPHEIANVLGLAGVAFMVNDAAHSPLKFCFGAPSCVPATPFETAGAVLGTEAVGELLRLPEIGYLSEMMNFPGVLQGDEAVLAKIKLAQQYGKPIDGHAPGLRGEAARQYFSHGISTDHECFTYEEGKEKAAMGVKILIREGSAARNFEALWPLINEFPEQVMFCSDDKHPDDLIRGHINEIAARAIAKGCDLFDVLRAACLHPVTHYGLQVGLLRVGDPADFIRVKDMVDFEVTETWINGRLVAKNGQSTLAYRSVECPNHFEVAEKNPTEYRVFAGNAAKLVKIIEAWDGQIVTGSTTETIIPLHGCLEADPSRDILKIVVVNRYAANEPPAIGFVRGFGLRAGAIASSVAHDSHNIVAIGADDVAIAQAVNAIISAKGGISACNGAGQLKVLPLPIAGLMSPGNGYLLAEQYAAIDQWTKTALGCTLRAPFMVLSFLALPVIPSLKITDLGLFDVDAFAFTEVWVN